MFCSSCLNNFCTWSSTLAVHAPNLVDHMGCVCLLQESTSFHHWQCCHYLSLCLPKAQWMTCCCYTHSTQQTDLGCHQEYSHHTLFSLQLLILWLKGSPLALVIANCYMESFEQQAVSSAAKKLEHHYRYVEVTHFVIWTQKGWVSRFALNIWTVSMPT